MSFRRRLLGAVKWACVIAKAGSGRQAAPAGTGTALLALSERRKQLFRMGWMG